MNLVAPQPPIIESPPHSGPITHVFSEGDLFFGDLLKSIAAASKRIWIESYIFAGDELGWRFGRALAERAQAGIDVRVLADAVGSAGIACSRLAIWLQQHGVEWRWFHPWTWRRPLRYNTRDHCKLAIIDDQAAYLGGFNIHGQSSFQLAGTRRWRDTHIRIGPAAVAALARTFQARWSARHVQDRFLSIPGGRILVSGPGWRCRRQLRCATARWIGEAKERLWITTPYLVPDRGLRRCLRQAARRDVDVRILIPERSDVAAVDWAARHVARHLIKRGISVEAYPGRFLHAKTMVRDDTGVWVGSANLDYRSLYHNYELNLIAEDPACNQQLAQLFARDSARTALIDTRPGRGERLRQVLAWRLRRWL